MLKYIKVDEFFYIGVNPCNHHSEGTVKHFQHSRRFSYIPFPTSEPNPYSEGYHCSDFHHH